MGKAAVSGLLAQPFVPCWVRQKAQGSSVMVQLSLSVELESVGLRERGFNPLCWEWPHGWEIALGHRNSSLGGFHLDTGGLNLMDLRDWPQNSLCLQGQDTSNNPWHPQLPFYPELSLILVQGVDSFPFLLFLHQSVPRFQGLPFRSTSLSWSLMMNQQSFALIIFPLKDKFLKFLPFLALLRGARDDVAQMIPWWHNKEQ